MPFVTSVSKKITAISKTDSQDFSQRNPRDQNAGIHRVPWGLGDLASGEGAVKIKRSRPVEEAEFQVTLRGWEIDTSCHVMKLYEKK